MENPGTCFYSSVITVATDLDKIVEADFPVS
jgi:hypothetical protein